MPPVIKKRHFSKKGLAMRRQLVSHGQRLHAAQQLLLRSIETPTDQRTMQQLVESTQTLQDQVTQCLQDFKKSETICLGIPPPLDKHVSTVHATTAYQGWVNSVLRISNDLVQKTTSNNDRGASDTGPTTQSPRRT